MKTRKVKTDRQRVIAINDKLALKLLRIRAKNRCQRCGSSSSSCNWHHIFSRRYIITRWDEDNLLLLCFGCHFNYAHSKIEEFRDFVISKMGEGKYMLLKQKALSVRPMKIVDLKMVRVILEQELKGLSNEKAKPEPDPSI